MSRISSARSALYVIVALFALCASSESEDAKPSAVDTEILLRTKLEEHLVQVNRQIKALVHFLDTHYKDYNYTEADTIEYVSNPINTYVMIKRTSMEWPKAWI
jgi:hypothetical protein